jgi:sugar/nucleoside kinase (ribokinase family)
MYFFNRPRFDFIAIGDIVVDDFIKIKDAEIENSEKDNRQKICLTFGDKIPYEANYLIPAAGNSSNATVAAARLGLKTALVTNLGNDEDGVRCLTTLKKEKIDTCFVERHPDLKTNHHYVLWHDDNRTILIKHEKYPYVLPNIGKPKWIYLSSLGENSLPFHEQIADYLDTHPEIKLAFQPGTYQIRFEAQKLARFYARAELFFCNKTEAKKILQSDSNDLTVLVIELKALGPKTVFVTDGRNGVYFSTDNEVKHLPIFPNSNPPIESTGAGDAFSATVTSGMIIGLSLEDSIKWGLVNSMSVVQQIGAQAGLLSRAQIEAFLKDF